MLKSKLKIQQQNFFFCNFIRSKVKLIHNKFWLFFFFTIPSQFFFKFPLRNESQMRGKSRGNKSQPLTHPTSITSREILRQADTHWSLIPSLSAVYLMMLGASKFQLALFLSRKASPISNFYYISFVFRPEREESVEIMA